MAGYTREEFREALVSAGLRPGDTVFTHSNIGFFGMPEPRASTEEVCRTLLGTVLEVIGPEGTFVVPTFTYSFCEGKAFDPDSTPSPCGALTEYVRTRPEAFRSHDPAFSVAAIGARAAELTDSAPQNSFGEGSFFQRFLDADGVVCNFNLDAGSTFLHHVERLLDVPYRFDKTFHGDFQRAGRVETRESTIWVRCRNSDETIAAFEPFDELARAEGLFTTARVGRGFVGAIRARACLELVSQTLPSRPWLLTRAEVTGAIPEVLLRD